MSLDIAEIIAARGKMPRSFVREYLHLKGYKSLESLTCEECDFLYLGPAWVADNRPEEKAREKEAFDHPLRFLWEHLLKGHKPGFSVCHTWYWDTGSPEARPEDRTPMVGWLYYGYQWDPEKGHFKKTWVDEDRDIA